MPDTPKTPLETARELNQKMVEFNQWLEAQVRVLDEILDASSKGH